MKLRSGQILGLAFYDRSILCALVTINGNRSVQKLARFNLPADASFEKPETIAPTFSVFLKSHGLSAGRAVIGLPARWIIAQEKELPPSDLAQTIDILRLQAERMALADHAAMVADFTHQPGTQATRVLLVGIFQQRLDQIIKLAESVGVNVAAVTSTSLSAANLLADEGVESTLLMLGEQNAELIVQGQGAAKLLRHMGSANVASIGSETRRALAMGGGASTRLLVWDGSGLSDADLNDLSKRAGLPVQAERSLNRLNASLHPAALNGGAAPASAFLPAVALAIAADHLPIDFLHSRLAPPKKQRITRQMLWTIIAIVCIVGAAAWLYFSVQSREAQAAALNADLKAMSESVKKARTNLAHIDFGRGFFGEKRGPYMECLKELSLAFNYEEAIWATALTLRDGQPGQLQGKCSEQQLAFALRDRLTANPKFQNVKLLDLRETTVRTREITFSIQFSFVGGK